MSKRRAKPIGIIAVVPLPDRYEAICEKCKTIHGQGEFAISITRGRRVHLVINDVPSVCCGTEHFVPLLFTDLDEASRKKKHIKEIVEDAGNLNDLMLLDVTEFCLSKRD